ncbi:cache domain-containing protein [Leucobacter sp. wl10]|uniref:cache domain-containing protein n=1 Tax=Leucobacter sp. wl10 TaxID=2304677 RepID=UPI000E5BF7F9|nr:cache domain-containing protein [Leucobacter sp. wl10]RGE24345.1 hypothetical protein D1J51_00995 [Leucobacter sp. wl10]
MTTAEVSAVIATIDEWLDDRFSHLEKLAEDFIALLRLDESARLDLGESVRRRLRALAVRYLADNAVVDGCGLIFARSALSFERGHLEWWVREDESRFARYSFGVVPGADRYYDYEHHEWFTRAFQDGVPALVGPYIDYLGVEAYVLTLTVPAAVDGVRVGAVGNDLQVADLETELLPVLQRSGVEMALVGRHGNVLVGNSSRLLPGLFVPDALDGFTRRRLGPEGAEVELLYRAVG